MGLDELVKKNLNRVPLPEAEKRKHFNGAKVLIAKDPPEGWVDTTTEYAAPFESEEKYPRTWRVSKSWEEPPAVMFGEMKVSEKETLRHIFPHGIVGTENIGLPPRIATLCQELRDRSVDPTDQTYVDFFQSRVADTLTLFLPLVYGRIMSDKLDKSAHGEFMIDYSYMSEGRPIETRQYHQLFQEKPFTSTDEKQAIGGGISRAQTAGIEAFQSILLDVRNKLPIDLEMTMVAIHRGGILPCIMGQYIAKEFGIEASIVGIDSDRTNSTESHYDKVTGACLSTPKGYNRSEYSDCIDGFVFPKRWKIKPEPGKRHVHLFIDTMLATGSSSCQVIEEYMRITGCAPEDVYVVSLFAGSYDGLNKLQDLGVNVITLVHDQCDLTSNGYIQVGLGDAGDKQSLEGRNDTFEILKHMQHIAYDRNDPALAACINEYSLQITGKSLRGMEQFAGRLTGEYSAFAR